MPCDGTYAKEYVLLSSQTSDHSTIETKNKKFKKEKKTCKTKNSKKHSYNFTFLAR